MHVVAEEDAYNPGTHSDVSGVVGDPHAVQLVLKTLIEKEVMDG